MITVGVEITKYCIENNLPHSSGKDRCIIGQTIRDRFNIMYLKSPIGPIEGTSLVKIMEDDRPMVVMGYPDEFLPSVISCIANFYSEKQKRMNRAEADRQEAAKKKEKPMRPRIPAKTAVYSGRK